MPESEVRENWKLELRGKGGRASVPELGTLLTYVEMFAKRGSVTIAGLLGAEYWRMACITGSCDASSCSEWSGGGGVVGNSARVGEAARYI